MQDIMSRVPQGSVPAPLFFDIFVNDFIFAMKFSHVCNFADDNTLYACDKDVELVAMRLEDDISIDLDWFKDKEMVANPKKFQVMLLGIKQHQEFLLEIEKKSINVTKSVKILGMDVDDELEVDKHVKTLCQKVSRKVSAFSRVAPYIERHDPVPYIYKVHLLSTYLDVLQ